MSTLNLQRNTRLFYSTQNLAEGQSPTTMNPSNTWEILILEGSSISYASSTVTVSSLESGEQPDRSSETFITSVQPVTYSFKNYLRTTDCAYISLNGRIKPLADWFMWQSLVSNTSVASYETVWTYGGNLLVGEQQSSFRAAASTVNYAVVPENHLYFALDNVVYQASSATVDSLVLDADINSIATSNWSGQARSLIELSGSNRDNAISVFGGVSSTGSFINSNTNTGTLNASSSYHPFNKMVSAIEQNNAYIKNKLSELVITYGEDTYSFPLTALSFSYENNNKYLIPEIIGSVNSPIGAMTGNRVIAGTGTTYLRRDSATLLAAITSNNRNSSASFASATIYIGGNSYPRVAISLPSIMLDFPTIAVDDIVSVNFTYAAQQKEVGEQVTVSAAQRSSADATILDLFTSYKSGLWYDFRDKNYLYQDSAGTIPVTAAGQPVGKVIDKSGNGNSAIQPVNNKRPIYTIRPNSGVRNLARGSSAFDNTAYWPTSSTSSGITSTKIGTGIDSDNIPYVDIRYVGTSTSTSHTTAYVITAGNNPGVAGDIWTAHGYAQIIAGSMSGVLRPYLLVAEQTAPNTPIVSTSSLQSPMLGGESIKLTATSPSFTTGNQVGMRVALLVLNNVPVDVTVRWKAIQLEKNANATSWQKNLSAYEIYEANTYSIAGVTADGVDDCLYSEADVDFSATNSIGVLVACIKTSDLNTAALVELSDNSQVNNGSFGILASVGSNNWTSYARGTVLSTGNITNPLYTANNPVALDVGYVIPNDVNNFRANMLTGGSSNTDLGSGNFGSYPVYIFSRGNATLPFDGFCSGVYIRNTLNNRTGPAYHFIRDIGIE